MNLLKSRGFYLFTAALCILLVLAALAAVDWELGIFADRYHSGMWLFAADLITFATLAAVLLITVRILRRPTPPTRAHPSMPAAQRPLYRPYSAPPPTSPPAL